MALYGSLAVTPLLNGKRFASGTVTPADEDVDVVTGLRTVEYGGVSLAGIPTINHTQSIAEASSTEGNLRIRSYKPTGAGDATPAVSSTEVEVAWWAVGT